MSRYSPMIFRSKRNKTGLTVRKLSKGKDLATIASQWATIGSHHSEHVDWAASIAQEKAWAKTHRGTHQAQPWPQLTSGLAGCQQLPHLNWASTQHGLGGGQQWPVPLICSLCNGHMEASPSYWTAQRSMQTNGRAPQSNPAIQTPNMPTRALNAPYAPPGSNENHTTHSDLFCTQSKQTQINSK